MKRVPCHQLMSNDSITDWELFFWSGESSSKMSSSVWVKFSSARFFFWNEILSRVLHISQLVHLWQGRVPSSCIPCCVPPGPLKGIADCSNALSCTRCTSWTSLHGQAGDNSRWRNAATALKGNGPHGRLALAILLLLYCFRLPKTFLTTFSPQLSRRAS